jgi:AcrR family transcriptional regulator
MSQAARIGMSTRTFYRYYKRKDDVLAARLISHGHVIADGMAGRGDFPPLEAVAQALLDAVAAEGADERLLRRIIVLSWAERDLRARWLAAGRRTQDTSPRSSGSSREQDHPTGPKCWPERWWPPCT